MKTLLAILNGGADAPKVSLRHLFLGLIYAIGLFVVLLQLRSMF